MGNKLTKSTINEKEDGIDSQDSDSAEMNIQDEIVYLSVGDLKNTTGTSHYQQNVTTPLPIIEARNIPESKFECDIKGPSEDKSTDVPTRLTCSKETAHEQQYAQAPLPIVVARNIPESKFEFDITRPCEVRITGIAAIELDRLVLCNNKGKMLFVYNTFGKYLQEVELLASPFDIAVLSDNKTAVVSFQGEKYIQLVMLSPTAVSSGDQIEIRNPCTGGISIYDDGFAVGINRGIEIYTRNGQLVNSVKSSVENISYLKYAQEKYIYTNGLYYILKNFGRCQKKVNIKSDTKIQRRPLGIVLVSNHKYSYIADYMNDNIIKWEIEDLRWGIELSNTDGLYGPRALCVDGDVSKLFIANNDGQSIYIHCLNNN